MLPKQGGSRLLIGLWILSGLLTAGFNAYALMTLLDAPLSGYSDDVRMVDRGMQRVRTLMAAKPEKDASEASLWADRFLPMPLKNRPVERNPVVMAPVKNQAPESLAALPSLAGIMTRHSADGAVNRLALLDGNPIVEGDTIAEFTVKEITSRGVLLAHRGRTFFIAAPRITHSLTTR